VFRRIVYREGKVILGVSPTSVAEVSEETILHHYDAGKPTEQAFDAS